MREFDSDPSRLDEALRGRPVPDPVETTAVLVEAIDRLPPPMRDVVNCVFWERLSVRQTALSLGVHRITVERRLSEAFRSLREELEAEGFGSAAEALLPAD